MIRVAIVGLGLIGGSIARRLDAAQVPVVGFDADAAVRAQAAAAGIAVAGSAGEAARGADVVVVATPPAVTGAAVAAALEADRGCVVLDVASVKRVVVEAVAALAPAHVGRFLPAHPLAGGERSGWVNARADLLDAAVWALCPPPGAAGAEPLARAGAVLDALGARAIFCTAAAHDAALARTSHAPHVIAQALAGGAADPLAAALSGGALRDATRVADSDGALWESILALNSDEACAAIDEAVVRIEALRQAVAGGDVNAMRATWHAGQAGRALVADLRWTEPSWEAATFGSHPWDALLALGREGRAVRALRLVDGALHAQVAAARADS